MKIVAALPVVKGYREIERKQLLSQLQHYLPEMEICISEQSELDISLYIPNRIAAWHQAISHDPDWILGLDDDIDISSKITDLPQLLKSAPSSVITFCGFQRNPIPGYRRIQPAQFYGQSCLAVRDYVVNGFLRWIPSYLSIPHDAAAFDYAFRKYCQEYHVRIHRFFPSLVQHRAGVSLLGNRRGNRKSRMFS